MRTLITISYLFSFLVHFGNILSPELRHHHVHNTAEGLIGKALFITAANTIEIVDLDLPDVVEDNSTGGNQHNNSKDFSQNDIVSKGWAFCFLEQSYKRPELISCLQLKGNVIPIYLKNRVLRI